MTQPPKFHRRVTVEEMLASLSPQTMMEILEYAKSHFQTESRDFQAANTSLAANLDRFAAYFAAIRRADWESTTPAPEPTDW